MSSFAALILKIEREHAFYDDKPSDVSFSDEDVLSSYGAGRQLAMLKHALKS